MQTLVALQSPALLGVRITTGDGRVTTRTLDGSALRDADRVRPAPHHDQG